LTLGYAVLFCIALLLLELALYVVLRGALVDEIDKALRDRGAQVERALLIRGAEDINQQQLSADIFVLAPSSPGQELTAPGIHIRVLSVEGQEMAVSDNVAAQLPDDQQAIARAVQGQTTARTIRLDGTPVRVLFQPLRLGGEVRAVVQLGESLHPTERTLARTRRLLLAGGVIALISGLLWGWWLTRQSLRPVVALTDAVAEIASTGAFDRRVPQPGTDDEIGRLAATFNGLLERLNLMLDRQRTLVADTSHELRNPLMVVRGNVELLQHELPSAARKEATGEALEEIDRMTRLIEDLLFLADADANTAIERRDVALHELLAEVAEDARLIATRTDGTREVVLRANDPLIVCGDEERLRQMIWNLVENAVRYTPAGGTITLALRRRGPVAELTVGDTGIGIAPEHLPHLFERFYRVDTGRSRALGGTGLGLSIVRQTAEAHGGQVRVRSTVGEGSTFTVALPVARRVTSDEC
jgi:heavy metal sensor kinase